MFLNKSFQLELHGLHALKEDAHLLRELDILTLHDIRHLIHKHHKHHHKMHEAWIHELESGHHCIKRHKIYHLLSVIHSHRMHILHLLHTLHLAHEHKMHTLHWIHSHKMHMLRLMEELHIALSEVVKEKIKEERMHYAEEEMECAMDRLLKKEWHRMHHHRNKDHCSSFFHDSSYRPSFFDIEHESRKASHCHEGSHEYEHAFHNATRFLDTIDSMLEKIHHAKNSSACL